MSLKELQWWIAYMYKPISYPVLSVIIHSHTSKKKWHSVFSNGNKIGGRWSSSEALKHINTLELQPRAMFGLKYFAEQKSDTVISNCSWIIQLLLHFYINNMGESHSQELEEIARDLWDWSIECEIWISAVHTSGICDVDADDQSRNLHDKHEWALTAEYRYSM